MHKDQLPPEGEGDQDLVLKAASGDEQAFTALIRRKREKVFWIAYRIVGDEEDARDIAQATFIRLWKVLARFRQDQNFDTWLYRITVNLAIDHYRSRGHARETVPLPEHEDPTPEASARRPATGDPGQSLAAGELRTIFDKLAVRLGAKQRAIFVMSQIEGVPTEEISRIMGISHSTVRNHLFQARRTLQEGLRQDYPEYVPKDAQKKQESKESKESKE